MGHRGSKGAGRDAARSELWSCPTCGAKFVNRNQWHSCGLATLDDWLDRVGPAGRALYERFEALVGSCGEYHVAPAKTRIAFLGHVRFAGITKLTDDEMRCTFALPYEIRSQRFAGIEKVAPGWVVHKLHVTAPHELDDEVEAWIRESHRLMGMRERLNRSPTPGRPAGSGGTPPDSV